MFLTLIKQKNPQSLKDFEGFLIFKAASSYFPTPWVQYHRR